MNELDAPSGGLYCQTIPMVPAVALKPLTPPPLSPTPPLRALGVLRVEHSESRLGDPTYLPRPSLLDSPSATFASHSALSAFNPAERATPECQLRELTHLGDPTYLFAIFVSFALKSGNGGKPALALGPPSPSPGPAGLIFSHLCRSYSSPGSSTR